MNTSKTTPEEVATRLKFRHGNTASARSVALTYTIQNAQRNPSEARFWQGVADALGASGAPTVAAVTEGCGDGF